MPETGFRRRPREERASPARELRTTAVTSARFVRAQPLLLLMIAITFFEGMSTETVDRLWEAHFIRDVGLPALWSLDPVVWFALFAIPALPIGYFAAGRLANRFAQADMRRLARTLMVLTAVMMAAQLAFGLATAIGSPTARCSSTASPARWCTRST